MDPSSKFLIPREGLLVRDPVTFVPLPAGGMLLPWTGKHGRYWKRRVRCGDVIIGKPLTVRTMTRKDPLKKED